FSDSFGGRMVHLTGLVSVAGATPRDLFSPAQHDAEGFSVHAWNARFGQISARYSFAILTTIEPSPTADATRVIPPARTSPAANTPGTLVSRGSGSRVSFQTRGYALAAIRSRPVSTNPLSSRSTSGGSQSLRGLVPMKTNNASASSV